MNERRQRRQERRADRKARRKERKRSPLGTAPGQEQLQQSHQGLSAESTLAGAQFQQDRRQMQGVADQYAAMAQGQGPSLAQQQLQQSTDQNIANTMAMMHSGTGGNMNAMGGQAAAAGAALNQQAVQQAAQLRSQEQLAAMSGQAGIAGQMANMSMNRQGQFAGMGQQGLLTQQQMAQDFQIQNRMLAEQRRRERGDRWIEGIGLGGEVVGNVAGAIASDERVKTDVEDGAESVAEALAAIAEGDAEETLSKLEPKSWKYTKKGRKAGGLPGKNAGVMAQALAATEVGKSMVSPDENGVLKIDMKGAVSLLLAGAAAQEKRLRKVEESRG